MKTRFVLAACFALLPLRLSAQAISEFEIEKGLARVEVIAFDNIGLVVPARYVKVDAFTDSANHNLASRFHNGIAQDIPFGTYQLRGSASGARTETRSVSVYQPGTTVVLGLTIGEIADHAPGIDFSTDLYRLHGRVVGEPLPGKTAFARLVGLYSSFSAESGINPQGEFDFSGVLVGSYLLLVVGEEERVLATRQVNITKDISEDGSRLRIEIGRDHVVSRP